MSIFKNNHVITCAGIILWDGITKPEIDEKDGSLTHNLRIAIPTNAPELAELVQIANAALKDSAFKGVLPPGGNWPIIDADVAKFGPTLAGHTAFTAKTRRGVPQVFDLNGAEVSSIAFGRSFYPGARVKIIVHAYAYDNKQKGVAFGLDGIQIVDASAPALAIGGGINPTEIANAFGGVASAPAPSAPPPAAPAPAPITPHTAILAGPQMLPGAPNSYAEFKAAGWTDDQLIGAGYMAQPAAVTAAIAPPPAPSAPPPARVMLPAAGATSYDAYKQAGWTDQQLIDNGFMAA